jgi:hypothetical protein
VSVGTLPSGLTLSGGDNLGHARHGGIEQLHRESDGQREWEHNEGFVTDNQPSDSNYYDVVTARRDR